VDEAIVAGAESAYADGETGLGDTQIGFLYALIPSGAFQASVGLGVRLPTGSYKETPDNKIPTGRGITEAGLQLNLDLAPFRGMMISIQDQAGMMIKKGSKTVGDTSVDVERTGIRHVGFARVALGLGVLGRYLVPFGLTGTYNFEIDNTEKVDDVTVSEDVSRRSFAAGVRLDFYSTWKIPLRIDFEQERTLSGTNSYNFAGNTSQVKLLLKF
jgi:hypothetical protein